MILRIWMAIKKRQCRIKEENNAKKWRENDVLGVIKKIDRGHGVTRDQISGYLFLTLADLSQLKAALKDLVKSESIFECIPDFKTLPKTPKRYKVEILKIVGKR